MSTSNLKKRAAKRIKDYATNVLNRKVTGVRHIYPRCHVVGKAGSSCLIAWAPWQDAEQHLHTERMLHPLLNVYLFDPSIGDGDSIAVGYVTTELGGERVAVKMED